MLGAGKRVLVAVAVVGLCAAAPAVSSADRWTNDGSSPFAGTARAHGAVTVTIAGTSTTCDFTASLDLSNPMGVAHGQMTGTAFGGAAGGVCTTTIQNCTVAAVGDMSLPWTISTSGTSVTIAITRVTITYSSSPGQPPCPLSGQPVPAVGSITGVVSGEAIEFAGAGPMATPIGPAVVDSSVGFTDTNDNPITLY